MSIIIIYGFAISIISFLQIDIALFLGIPYKILIKILLNIIEFTSKIPFSKVYVKTPYMWQILLYYALLFSIWYLIKTNQIKKIVKYKKQIIAVILIIVLSLGLIEKLPQNYLKLYFIDVGQGDSCFIVTPENKKILIDRRRE
ncbi:MAG: ComEC/Rec2 family competence protein [Clostridia bacterium]|nr:ComEC/Rec2 family competence protein [Clostridia bacterium]